MVSQSNLHILVIDDNPDIHQDFLKILKPASFEQDKLSNLEETIFGDTKKKNFKMPLFKIDTALQGEEGIKKVIQANAENNPYVLAFVDIRMPPGLDGIETIKRIWEIEPDMQIVICTAYSDYSWEDTVAHLGQKDNLLIIKKPFDYTAVQQLTCALTVKWQLLQDVRNQTRSLENNVVQSKNFSSLLEEKLQHQITHDPLTDLPNRNSLLEFLQQLLQRPNAENFLLGILYIDLDKFQQFNNSLSYSIGNQLLKNIAKRLKSCIRDQDSLNSIGSDEFVIVITSLSTQAELKLIAAKIVEAFQESFKIEEYTLFITVSVGVSVFPQDAKTVDELLNKANIAVNCCKELGRNQYLFYNPHLSQLNAERFEMEVALRSAIENQEFILFYQPQLDAKTEKLIAVEALIRWQHPVKGLILPVNFIPLAESTGLIIPIGDWVIKEACQQNKKWQELQLQPIRVAVNLSALQLKRHNIIKVIDDALKETGLQPEYLELELTETIILNSAEALATIDKLKALGVQITLDDFGIGFSSLNYLREMSIDRIKIDQSFVKNIHVKTGDEIIIQAIMTMAQNLNLDVLAEGVETVEQLEFLRAADCNEIQGYYFSKPIPSTELEYFLRNPDELSIQAKKRAKP
jgi:diguanylate cyclase